jgi:YVTN family beta-propeller protein/autotransporter-associated beta strand protein
MNDISTLARATCLWLALSSVAQAANGTWNNPAGGSWASPANWLNTTPADGAGSTANFATLSLAGDATVTLDGARTIGSLSFDDKSAPQHAWTLAPGTGGKLTLSATTPVINVNQCSAIIEAGLSGTGGFSKAGPGLLVLAGLNDYTGTTAVNGGTLRFGSAGFSAASPLTIGSAGIVQSAGTLGLLVNATATALPITGSGRVYLVGTNNSATAPDLDFGPNHSANSFWGARLAAPVDLGDRTRFVHGRTGHNGAGRYGLASADCQFGGEISGTGGLTIIAQNSWTGSDPMEVPFALNASNTFTGPLEIRRGSVYLGAAGAVSRTNRLVFAPVSGHNARLFLYGNHLTVSDLTSIDAGNALIANGNRISGASLTLGPATLFVEQRMDGTFSGVITDTFSEYDGSGSGTTGPLSLVKRGSALLTLSGSCTYSGGTTVAEGGLRVNGAVAGPLVVQNGVLSGAGAIKGNLQVQAGGALMPGVEGTGTLSVQGALELGGTTVLDIGKAGIYLAGDHVTGISTLKCGGKLVVTNRGPGALMAGDRFQFFQAQSVSGSFAQLELPPLGGGLVWDTADLTVDGSLTVIDASGVPVITQQPQSLQVIAGEAARFEARAAGERPLQYQWLKNGQLLQGQTSSSVGWTQTTTNEASIYSLWVSNVRGSVTSAVAQLTVTEPLPASPVTNGLVVYLNFNSNIVAQAGTTNNGALYTGGATLGPRYIPGPIGAAVAFANTSTGGQPDDWAITLGNLDWVYSGSFTVSMWEKNSTTGDGALSGNKNWSSGANTGWVISTLDPKNLNYNAVGGTRRDVSLNPGFSDGAWHLVTITFDRTANRVTSYLDGSSLSVTDISPNGSASLSAGFPTLIGSSGNGSYSGTGAVDDYGIWRRALSSEEVAAIYHAGLIGQALVTATPGPVPQITANPAGVRLTEGGTAQFSVQVSGTGPFAYQWRLNGTNIAGATDSTFTLSSVGPAQEGMYTVLVSNGSGGVISAAARLSVYELAVTGQWDFSSGDLRPTVGRELEYVGNSANLIEYPEVQIQGRPVRVMYFGAMGPGQGLYARHGVRPNGGGHLVNQYTIVMDVMYPQSSTDHWRALFQSDPFNRAGNDAEFYVGDAFAAPDPNGIGGGGLFHHGLTPGAWHRVAFVVDLAAAEGQQLRKYVDGEAVAVQALPGGLDGRYALGPTVQLFTNGLGEDLSRPGYVSSIQILNGCLAPAAVAALGEASPDKLPAGNAALQLSVLASASGGVSLSWSGPAGSYLVQSSSSLEEPFWVAAAPPQTNRMLQLPSPSGPAFYRVVLDRPDIQVGMLEDDEQVIPSKQILRVLGSSVQFGGRPVDLARSPDGRFIYLKNLNNLVVVDAASWKVVQTSSYPGSGASMHGIACRADGSRVYVTSSGSDLYEWQVAGDGLVSFVRTISLPASSNPCGVAISEDGSKAYVCLNNRNRLGVVNLTSGGLEREITVGIAPWDVLLSPGGGTAYVSDWGGRFPVSGDLTASSSGTQVVVDARGVASSGTVSFVDVGSGTKAAQVAVGLHPSAMALRKDGATLYVANANSDTVSVIDTASRKVQESILVRPDSSMPYGSGTGGLALSGDERFLFVASPGNNAVAVVELAQATQTNSMVRGYLPTDWYPGAVEADSNYVYVANVKGLGTRLGQPVTTSWQITAHLGTANRLAIPNTEALSKHTALAFENGRVPEILRAQAMPRAGQPPVPVPQRRGEPSVFKHVVYILKENKTYDQMFGDLPQGNGEPSLCIYPRFISPNHHALAEQYVLLDNFYCQGVNSADGHSWSTEGNVADYLEKSFGGFARSYTFGDDPLTYSSTGFIWNNVLEHGLTFRNYGEMDYASPSPAASWFQIYRDFTNGTRSIRYSQNIGIASLRPYSSTNVPGWNMEIPDVVRADGFIRELNQAQARGTWENFHFLYLPNDHTGGAPSPRAQVADNDVSLGRAVAAITHSIFASNTVIFVIEDDPQSGYDHVDGHRSICLVISPYTKRGAVISTFYNQAGVLHTMERIMGLPPMNQQDAMAPLMFECFTNVPNFTPYTALPSNIDLAEGVGGTAGLTPTQQYWAAKASQLDLSRPDAIEEDTFNRHIWHSIKGDAPYPADYVGAHGKGLKALGLSLSQDADDDDDD